jgi:hypothetical protein
MNFPDINDYDNLHFYLRDVAWHYTRTGQGAYLRELLAMEILSTCPMCHEMRMLTYAGCRTMHQEVDAHASFNSNWSGFYCAECCEQYHEYWDEMWSNISYF